MIEIKFKGDLKDVITEIVNFQDALNAPLNPNLDSAGASQNATPSAAVNSAANVVPAHLCRFAVRARTRLPRGFSRDLGLTRFA